MLESPEVSETTEYCGIIHNMSKKVISEPDNQQERFLEDIPQNLAWVLVGFTEGEGSFNLSVIKRGDYVIKWQLNLSFNISQRDPSLLKVAKETLQCGSIRYRKDGVYAFEVRAINDITEKIIPFFDRFTLFSKEKRDAFKLFKSIAKIMKSGEHTKIEGFKKVLKLRSVMNPRSGRKRKYSDRYILNSFKKILRDYTPSPVD